MSGQAGVLNVGRRPAGGGRPIEEDTMTIHDELIRFETEVSTTAPPEVVYDVLADLRTHLQWAGTEAPRADFRLLDLTAPEGPAEVGTTFTSTGDAGGGDVFHDSSVVTEATRPSRLTFQTAARLDRRRRPPWLVQFTHRYTVQPAAEGSRIRYLAFAEDANYRPWWLQPGIRSMTRWMMTGRMRKQLANLVALVEQRAVQHS